MQVLNQLLPFALPMENRQYRISKDGVVVKAELRLFARGEE
jgi:hypothetical protein